MSSPILLIIVLNLLISDSCYSIVEKEHYLLRPDVNDQLSQESVNKGQTESLSQSKANAIDQQAQGQSVPKATQSGNKQQTKQKTNSEDYQFQSQSLSDQLKSVDSDQPSSQAKSTSQQSSTSKTQTDSESESDSEKVQSKLQPKPKSKSKVQESNNLEFKNADVYSKISIQPSDPLALTIMADKGNGNGSCSKSVITAQSPNLRWNVDKNTADNICCHNQQQLAEHSGYFETVTEFMGMIQEGINTEKLSGSGSGQSDAQVTPIKFYDPMSPSNSPPKLLFTAPINRSYQQFLDESKHHGWPSFRDQEVNTDNVRVLVGSGGDEVVSIDGTHLGHNIPDANGNRYCINLVSVAGQSSQLGVEVASDGSVSSESSESNVKFSKTDTGYSNTAKADNSDQTSESSSGDSKVYASVTGSSNTDIKADKTSESESFLQVPNSDSDSGEGSAEVEPNSDESELESEKLHTEY